ncbi:putative ercc4 domain-containing protein [Erysiphe necator]|uniref:Putative ercc4 domain-containing protein n=1 Tax=Uncinula necator TaxID=52586 RepID=A0A0B1P6G8_UNCNE|nr:putative ercc4 domain-containing protein [Erysiphe necator]
MSNTIIDLCSSPEVGNNLSQKNTNETLLLRSSQRNEFLNPPSFDWYDVSPETSDREIANLRPAIANVTSLPIIPYNSEENEQLIGTQNEFIDLISDETDNTEIRFSPSSKSWLDVEQFDDKREVELDTNIDKNGLKKFLNGHSRNERNFVLDSSTLSDPFVSTPIKNQRSSSAPSVVCSRLSATTEKINSSSKFDTEFETKSTLLIREESPKPIVNNFTFNLGDARLSSSPSIISDQSYKRKEMKRKLTTVISDDEIDEAWITELVRETEKKKGKAKHSCLSKASNKSRRKKVTSLDMGRENGDVTISKSGSANLHAKEDAIKKNEEKLKQKEERRKRKEEKLELKEEKAKMKEAEKLLKIKEKEKISLKKEWENSLNKMNKLKSKVESTPEMIVDIPSCLDEKLADQVRLFLDGVKAKHSTYGNSNNIIKWRRKVQAEWDLVDNHWKPVDERIEDEKHVLYAVKCQELIELIGGLEGHDLNAFLLKLTMKFNDCKIIFLIEGLKSWLSKNKAIRDKDFTNNVRNQILNNGEPSSQSTNPRKQRTKQSHQSVYVDKNKIEDTLLRLHVAHNVLIHHTNNPHETAEWIMRFTQHISTIPYRKQFDTMNTANFCIETGQIDSGKDLKDTYILMLQQMHLVTPSIAWGIESRYGNVQALIRGLEEKGPLALEHCRKSANKNGAFTDTRIGQSISRRVYSVFLGEDAWNAEI